MDTPSSAADLLEGRLEIPCHEQGILCEVRRLDLQNLGTRAIAAARGSMASLAPQEVVGPSCDGASWEFWRVGEGWDVSQGRGEGVLIDYGEDILHVRVAL